MEERKRLSDADPLALLGDFGPPEKPYARRYRAVQEALARGAALVEAERELSKANGLLAAADRLSGQDIVTMQTKVDYQKECVHKAESRVRELEKENARLRAALRYTWTAWEVGQHDYFGKLKSIRATFLGGGKEPE